MNSFRLQNLDLRWYVDKYLIIAVFICSVAGMALLWNWPLAHQDVLRGLAFLAAAGVGILLSPRRLLITTGFLVIVFFRGLIGVAIYHSAGALALGLAGGAVAYYLIVKKRPVMALPYHINDYSYSELLIDCAVLGSALWVYAKFLR